MSLTMPTITMLGKMSETSVKIIEGCKDDMVPRTKSVARCN